MMSQEEITEEHALSLDYKFSPAEIKYLAKFFRCFQEKHPGQNIQVFYMWNRQIEELLEAGTIDLGVSLLPVQNNALLLKKLFTEQLYCIVNNWRSGKCFSWK